MIQIEDFVLKLAGMEHIHALTEMNQQLIIDELSENPMNYTELHNRMTEFLKHDWKAMLLMYKGDIVGYGLYQERRNMYDPSKEEIYLRQYFIKRAFRGLGLGREGIRRLRAEIFPYGADLFIDVLEQNQAGRRFWESVGFKPYYNNMKLQSFQ